MIKLGLLVQLNEGAASVRYFAPNIVTTEDDDDDNDEVEDFEDERQVRSFVHSFLTSRADWKLTSGRGEKKR